MHRIGSGRRVPLNAKQTGRAGSAVCAQFVLRAFCEAYFQSLTIDYRFREPMLTVDLRAIRYGLAEGAPRAGVL